MDRRFKGKIITTLVLCICIVLGLIYLTIKRAINAKNEVKPTPTVMATIEPTKTPVSSPTPLPTPTPVIYDTERNICYVHSDNGKGMVYTDSDRQMYNMINSYSDTDKQYEDLWVKFFETIAIKERVNERLQMNMLPLKYRKYLPEMN